MRLQLSHHLGRITEPASFISDSAALTDDAREGRDYFALSWRHFSQLEEIYGRMEEQPIIVMDEEGHLSVPTPGSEWSSVLWYKRVTSTAAVTESVRGTSPHKGAIIMKDSAGSEQAGCELVLQCETGVQWHCDTL